MRNHLNKRTFGPLPSGGTNSTGDGNLWFGGACEFNVTGAAGAGHASDGGNGGGFISPIYDGPVGGTPFGPGWIDNSTIPPTIPPIVGGSSAAASLPASKAAAQEESSCSPPRRASRLILRR